MTLDLGSGTVAAMIAGGSWVETGESTLNITGSTNLTFKSGTYTGQIWGGSYINGTATAALTGNIGSTNITITGGTFDGAQISLGTYVERNNTNSALTIGEANLSISGGTFNNASIYAGGQKVNGTALTTALTNVTITGNDAILPERQLFPARAGGYGYQERVEPERRDARGHVHKRLHFRV